MWLAFAVCMEVIPLYYLLIKDPYYVEHNAGFILIQVVPLHVCYAFRPFL